MAKYIRDEKVEPLVKKVVLKYPNDFGFIEPEDIFVVRDVYAMRHRAIASIRLVSGMYEPFFPRVGALLIIIRDCNWRKYEKNTRKMILYHELMHVEQETREGRLGEGYKYAIISHDMEEFYALIEAYGPRWLSRKDLPDILKEKIKIKRNLEEYPKL